MDYFVNIANTATTSSTLNVTAQKGNGVFTVNKKLACSPLITSIQKQGVGTGFITVKQKTNLVSTKVLFELGSTATVGQFVYLRGDVITLPWAKEVFELDGQKFILVPEDQVMVVSDKDLLPQSES